MMSFSRWAGVALCAVSFSSLAQSTPCTGAYAPGFVLIDGRLDPPVASLPEPGKAGAFLEPALQTCVQRATDHANEAPSGFARNDYSRRQAFNANSSLFIANANDGWWHLYDARTMQHLRALSPRVADPSVPAQYHLAGAAEPHWHPSDPNVLYYLPNNGGTKLLRLDVRTNRHEVAADFAGVLPAWAAPAAHIWTRSEGSPSADGRYWGFQVEDSSFQILGHMVWDLSENRLVSAMPATDRPDHVSMSASGRWYVISSDTTGTWAWSPDLTRKKKLHHKSEHSDLAFGPSRQDFYVSIDYQSNAGDFFYVDMDACPDVPASTTDAPVCPRTVLFPTYANGAATALHVSGKGFWRPGWVVVSTYAASRDRNGNLPWYASKVFLVELTPQAKTQIVAFTRNAGGGYFAEPHASVSRDFSRIAFNSNWGVSGTDLDIYLAYLPASSSAPPPRVTGGNLPPLVVPTSPSSTSYRQSASLPAIAPPAPPSKPAATTHPVARECRWLPRPWWSWSSPALYASLRFLLFCSR